VIEKNWAGNFAYTAHGLHHPTSLEQLQAIVRAAPSARVLGSRHTFNAIADSSELISLADLPIDISIDRQASTVACSPPLTYGALAQALEAEGLALHNLASLPHVSVGGAISTATHGSGDRNGNLATAVAGLELVASNGEIVRASRGDADFEGMVVGLGALGAVIRVTLDVEPAYQVRQTVYEGLSWRSLFDNFDAVTSSGYSVSLFTDWGDRVDQVWVKTRVRDGDSSSDPDEFVGAPAARVDLHPLPGADASSCTAQRGQPGTWWQRLPHFRLEHQPSAGDELQSEYMVSREHALAAIEAVRGLSERIRPLLFTAEIRTVAADGLWLSPEYARDSVCLHFTWRPRQSAVEALLSDIESVLAPFEARPHWGKLFMLESESISKLYPRLPDFLQLADKLDPKRSFTNRWFTTHVRGDS
jgi:xylitol oxidase